MFWEAPIMIILHTYHILWCHYNNYLRNNAIIIHETIMQPPKLSLVLPWSSKGRQWLINLTILHLARANTRQWLNYLIISDLFRHPHHTISCMCGVLTILTRLTILGNNLQANIHQNCTGEGILVWHLLGLCLKNMRFSFAKVSASSSSISWEIVYQDFVSKYLAILSNVWRF